MLFDANHGYDAFINALQFLGVHRKFKSDDVIGPAVLKRFAFLNQVIPAFIKLLHRDVAVTCQHCGKHENTVEPCKGCQSIFFCVDGKHKDKRLVDTAGWKSVRSYWENDFSKRKIVEGFMKDTLLGSKRLASMRSRIARSAW